LSDHGHNPPQINLLSKKLSKYFIVKSFSNKINKTLRLFHMISGVCLNYNRNTIILIDTYSHYAFYYALICSILCKILQIKYIPILRGGNLPFRLEKNPFLSKIIFGNSFHNVTPSIYLEKYFNNHQYKTKYIPNVIEINNYPFQLRTKVYPQLLWVRSLHKSYNPQMAIEVLAELIKTYPESKLTMVGPDKDGSVSSCLNYAKALKVDKNIHFTGKLEKQEWISFSKKFDIFINTTNYDNMPVSVIEAMALGFPIVSTNAGGLKYLLNDSVDSFLVDKNDVYEMVKKIDLLINNKVTAKKLSLNARKRAETFCWDNVKNTWLNVLKL
tara:strand:+ start:6517 stop:7500 length:984 start_codon:yes stop_codon:yes gene_type:complete